MQKNKKVLIIAAVVLLSLIHISPSKYMLYELRKNGKDFYLYSVTTIMNDSVSGTEFNTGTVGRVDTLTSSDSQGGGNTQAP